MLTKQHVLWDNLLPEDVWTETMIQQAAERQAMPERTHSTAEHSNIPSDIHVGRGLHCVRKK